MQVAGQRVQALLLLPHRIQLALQRTALLLGRGIQQRGDGAAFHAKCPIKQDLLEPPHLRGAVGAVAVFPHRRGRQQADLVIVAQRPGCDPRQLRQLMDGIVRP